MMDNAGPETSQLSILRATVASGATLGKERLICGDILQVSMYKFSESLFRRSVLKPPPSEKFRGVKEGGSTEQPNLHVTSLSTFCIWEFSKRAPAQKGVRGGSRGNERILC